MKIKKILFCICIVVISSFSLAKAQTPPGYMGKRLLVKYNFSYLPFDIYDLPQTNTKILLPLIAKVSTAQGAEVLYVLTRKTALGLSYNFLNFEENDFQIRGNGTYAFSRKVSNLKISYQRSINNLMPVRSYFGFDLLVSRAKAISSETSIQPSLILPSVGMVLGMRRVFFDALVLDINVAAALTIPPANSFVTKLDMQELILRSNAPILNIGLGFLIPKF